MKAEAEACLVSGENGFMHYADPVVNFESASPGILTVCETAQMLGVSQSWVRRHKLELPLANLPGRMVRFDGSLLSAHVRGTLSSGKSLKPGRKVMLSRYQRGSVRQIGKAKVWYGTYREDVKTADGAILRSQRKVRLGTPAELPTKNSARAKLADLLANSQPTTEITFRELVDRWKAAEGPTLKSTSFDHYKNALRAYALPAFGTQTITNINREAVQKFLAEKAAKYSKSTLRSMRVVLSLTLGWAKNCDWIEANPCEGVRLPRVTGGRKIIRTVLTGEQILALTARLKEPYATLVLFLAVSGVRIGEAAAVKGSSFSGNTLLVTQRISNGKIDSVKSKKGVRGLPLDPGLVARMFQLGPGEWIFRSRRGTCINPGNALKRYIRPAAEALGIHIGGWHDFRHTLNTTLRRDGTDPGVRARILGQSGTSLATDVYDHPDASDFVQPLAVVAGRLLPSCDQPESAA
jgi:integrase